MRGLTEKVYEFTNGKVKEHLGDIDYFLKRKQATDIKTWEGTSNKQKESKQEIKTVSENKLSFEERKRLKKLR